MRTEIIESKDYIPWVLRRSRDMQAFCKILDLLLNAYKTNSDYLISLIDFNSCPNSLLPLLASYVGYNYDYNESYDANRMIIKHYPFMIHNRGSELGISLAASLSINITTNIDQLESMSMFKFEYVKSENLLKIYVFMGCDTRKLRDLIEVVRPAGCAIVIIPADLIQTLDGIEIHSYEQHTKYAYDLTRYSVSDNSKVAFSEVVDESFVPDTWDN